jgi:Aspartyl protease
MRKFNFKLSSDDDLILVEALVNNFPLILALDTAASQTVIDWNALFLAGCVIPPESEFKETVPVETASGVMEVPIYEINDFNTLGIQSKNFSVLTYDFLAKGLTSPYDGVLGIDFFRKKWILTVDFIDEKLWLTSKKK